LRKLFSIKFCLSVFTERNCEDGFIVLQFAKAVTLSAAVVISWMHFWPSKEVVPVGHTRKSKENKCYYLLIVQGVPQRPEDLRSMI
jgi:hypothetical protein